MVAFVATMTVVVAQDYKSYDDVIYGTDGSIVRGTITEQIPGVSYKIATHDGNIFVYDALEVEKITKEPPVANYYQSNGQKHRYDEYGNVLYKKSPIWSAIGSVFVPGLGQLMNGQTRKGFGIIGVNIISAATFYTGLVVTNMTGSEAALAIGVVGLAGMLATHIYSIVDAPMYASRWNEENGFAVGDNKWLKIEPGVGVSSSVVTGTNATVGLNATFTF